MKKTLIWIVVALVALWLFVPKFKEMIMRLMGKSTDVPALPKPPSNAVAYTGTVYTADTNPKDNTNLPS